MKVLRLLHEELFHISFNAKLEGVWKPAFIDGADGNKTEMSEPEFPRISVAPTLEQCFWAIYPNVSKFFEEKNLPYMDMTVYSPVIKPNTKVMYNDEIVKDRLVHDAHITGECFILSDVEMVKVKTVRIYNCTRNKEIWYYPFNDRKFEKKFLSHEVKIEDL